MKTYPYILTDLQDQQDFENTDTANTMAKFMDFDLNQLTKQLYTNAKDALEKKGFTTRIDVTDPNNPVFVAKKGSQKVELPANKNIVIQTTKKSTKQTEFDGFANTSSILVGQNLQNHGLWFVFILFSLGRSLFLALYVPKLSYQLFPKRIVTQQTNSKIS